MKRESIEASENARRGLAINHFGETTALCSLDSRRSLSSFRGKRRYTLEKYGTDTSQPLFAQHQPTERRTFLFLFLFFPRKTRVKRTLGRFFLSFVRSFVRSASFLTLPARHFKPRVQSVTDCSRSQRETLEERKKKREEEREHAQRLRRWR